MEKELSTVVIIDDGATFEGTTDQFRNCFFDNADLDTIYDWCQKNGMKFKAIVSP